MNVIERWFVIWTNYCVQQTRKKWCKHALCMCIMLVWIHVVPTHCIRAYESMSHAITKLFAQHVVVNNRLFWNLGTLAALVFTHLHHRLSKCLCDVGLHKGLLGKMMLRKALQYLVTTSSIVGQALSTWLFECLVSLEISTHKVS